MVRCDLSSPNAAAVPNRRREYTLIEDFFLVGFGFSVLMYS